jgi:hypothetical protein
MTPHAKRPRRPKHHIPGTPADSTTIAARRAAVLRRLPPDPVCARCGFSAHLFELHHPAVRQHDGQLVVVVCIRCHRDLTVRQQNDGVPMRRQPTFLERLIAILEGLASFFRDLAESFIRHAQDLRRQVIGLDQDCAAWRGYPWAA